jgi:hypothetical protein
VPDENAEIAYYRAVEDLFSKLRGVPHLLSPKDFQLLRSWWQEAVPLEAVTAGVTEVMARKRLEDNADPVVSLGYCRHAVVRHAKRLAAARVGNSDAAHQAWDADEHRRQVEAVVRQLDDAADRHRADSPAVAEAIRDAARLVEAAASLSPGAADEHLYNVESQLVSACLAALQPDQLKKLIETARQEAAATGATGTAAERATAAFRDRELRRLLGLPRLELAG